MDINYYEGFLGETVNITFAAIEVSILVAYLIVTSIFQVIITSLFGSNSDLKSRVLLIGAKKRLRALRLITVITACTVIISTLAVLIKSCIIDCISLIGFILVIICFTTLIVIIINNLLAESEK
jgi:hypothetical protein